MYKDKLKELKNSFSNLSSFQMVRPEVIANAEHKIFLDIMELEKIYKQYIKDITGEKGE